MAMNLLKKGLNIHQGTELQKILKNLQILLCLFKRVLYDLKMMEIVNTDTRQVIMFGCRQNILRR